MNEVHDPALWDGKGEAVAVVGDWHGNWNYALKVLWSLHHRGIKRVIHVGDFGFWFIPEFVSKLDAALEQGGMHLWFVDGNHDDHELLASLAPLTDEPQSPRPLSMHMTYLPRGCRWNWDGLTWLGIGGAPSIDRAWRLDGSRKSWWIEERISDEDVSAAITGGVADIVVSHDAPSEIFIPLPAPHFPEVDQEQCRQSRERLQIVKEHVLPKVWLFGHYHQAWVKFENGTTYRALDCDETALGANIELVQVWGGEIELVDIYDLPAI